MFATDLTVTVTNSSLGLVAALIVSTEPWALPLLVVPLLTVFLAYRAYVSERKRGERLEFLYEANRTLSRSPEIAEALEGLLARSLDAFRAERAEIILWTPDKPPLRTTLGPGDHKEVMAEVDPEVAVDLQSLVSNDAPVVTLPDAARGSAVAAYLQERGVHKAMLAMLPGEDRVIGTLMLSNRYGVVRDFSADDLKLFETLANNALGRAAVRPPRAGDRPPEGPPAAAAPPGLPRLADRPPQPRAVHLQRARGARHGAAASSRSCSSTSTTSRPSTTRSATPSATSCSSRSPTACARACARRTRSPASAATSSPCACTTPYDAEGAAESVAKRIMEAFQLPIEAGGELLSIRLSVGIASAHQGAVRRGRADPPRRHGDVPGQDGRQGAASSASTPRRRRRCCTAAR